MVILTLSLFLARVISALSKDFACAGQLINTTPIQAVRLPTMMVTTLPFPFDQNELDLRNVEFWWLGKLLREAYKSDYIQSFLNVPRKHVLEKQKEIWWSKKNNIILSPLRFSCNIEKTKIMICYVNFRESISILVKDTTNPLQLFAEKCHFSNQNNQWINNIIYH